MLVVLLSQYFADRFCLSEGGFMADSTVQSAHAVVKKHVLRIVKGEVPHNKIPRLFSYAQKRLEGAGAGIWRWIKMSDEAGFRCGLSLWEEIYLAFPELAQRSDDRVIDSAAVLFSSMVRDSLKLGTYPRLAAKDTARAAEMAAWDILALSSFLNYLRDVGVERFREENTCGYW